MFGIHDFGIFLLTGILLNLTPGPDTFYVLGRGIAQGRSAGVASALGIGFGSVFHTFAAAFGLSAIIAASATSFMLIKLAGGVYLIYLGLRMILSRTTSNGIPIQNNSAGFFAILKQGAITNILNPKVALFYLAFMPQFIASDSQSKFAAFVALGVCFTITGTLWCLCLAWFSGSISTRLEKNSSFAGYINRIAGGLFVYLGARLAITK
jgi:threonine/homoserine/homoserine lactone efflux protein